MVVNKANDEDDDADDSDQDDELIEDSDFKELPEEQKQLLNRLYKFVIYFVEEIETRLITYHGIFEGKLKNAELPDNIAKLLGTAAGGVLYALFGSVTKIPAKMTAVGVEKLVKLSMDALGEEDEEKFNLIELVYGFANNREKGRLIFVKIALIVFHSFEIQFLRVTSNQGFRKAMRLLAKDAVDRFFNCFVGKESCVISAMNVLEGESKTSHYIPASIKSPGFKVLYEFNDVKRAWNTSKIFEKVGVVVKNNEKYDFYKRNTSNCEKYGYRRLFPKENLKDEYISDDVVFEDWPPNFMGDLIYYKKYLDPILNRINENDKNLSENRIIKTINQVKDELLNEIGMIKQKRLVEVDVIDVLNEKLISKEYVDDILNHLKEDYERVQMQLSYAIKHREVIALEITDRLGTLEGAIKNLMISNVVERDRIIFRLMSPVKSFTGRIKELELIKSEFENDKGLTVISQTTSITGFGGVGKSELAKKYAELFLERKYYKNALFMNSENRENILDSFKTLARRIDVPIYEQINNKKEDRDIKYIVEDIYEIFNGDNGKTLLIFDNVEEFVDIKDFLPKYYSLDRKIHVLITSRCQSWNVGELGEIKVIPLNLFTEKEAFDFVTNVLQKFELVKDEVDELIDRLQYFPLALKQATGYIKHKNNLKSAEKFTIKDYLKLFEQHTEQLLKNCEYEDYGNKTVMTTWTVAVESIKKNEKCGKLAVYIFNIMAYISPDNIEVDGLISNLESDQDLLWESINLLYNYSLISLHKDVIGVHRLMQEVLRLNLKNNKEEKKILEEVLKLLNRKDCVEHIIAAWTHAINYPEIIKEYYPLSFYGEYKDKPLHVLASFGKNFNTMESILNHFDDQNIDEQNQESETPIYKAFYYGDVEVFKFFMDKCASFSVLTGVGVKFLYLLISGSHQGIVDYMKQAKDYIKSDSDEIDEVCAFHIKFKEFVDLKDYDEINNFLNNSKHLIDSKYDGRTILHIATANCNKIVVEILLKFGAFIDCVDKNECTPLHYTSSLIDENSIEIMKLLLENGANINASNYNGEKPIHHALFKNNMIAFKLLLEYGANINVTDRSGITPAVLSLWSENLEALKIFLERGFFKNINVMDNRKALMIAIRMVNFDVIKLLLEHNTDAIVDEIVVLCYMSFGDVDVLKLLLECKSGLLKSVPFENIVKRLVKYRYENMLKFVLDEGVEMENLKLVLYESIRSDFTLEFLSFLLEKGAPLNDEYLDGKTPLKVAVEHGNLEIVKFLLKKGAKSSKWGLIDTSLRKKNFRLAMYLLKNL